MAHGVDGALLQRHAEDVVGSFARAESLEQSGLGEERPVVHLALGARIPARSGLGAGLAFRPHVAGDGLAGILAALVLLRLLDGRLDGLDHAAHRQRAGLDQLGLADGLDRHRVGPEPESEHHRQGRQRGDQDAFPIGALGARARGAADTADAQRQFAAGEQRDRPLRQRDHQALRVGLAATAHEKLGSAHRAAIP